MSGEVFKHLRALLITLVVLGAACEGLPIPRVSAGVLRADFNQQELRRWSARLTDWGYPITKPELEREVLNLSERFGKVHRVLSAPARVWLTPIAATQRWALFPVVDHAPWWLHVESRGRGESEFKLVFRPHDPEHVYQSRLVYRRMRGAWNPGTSGPRGDYGRFCDWIANQIFEGDPDAVEVRVRYRRVYLNRPGLTPRDTTPQWSHEQRRRR